MVFYSLYEEKCGMCVSNDAENVSNKGKFVSHTYFLCVSILKVGKHQWETLLTPCVYSIYIYLFLVSYLLIIK